MHVDFLFDDDETSTSRKNNMWIYWVDFEQEEGGQVNSNKASPHAGTHYSLPRFRVKKPLFINLISHIKFNKVIYYYYLLLTNTFSN